MLIGKVGNGCEGRPLYPVDVCFDRRAIPALSSHGTPYARWVRTGMPHLGQYAPLLKAVLFLYPDRGSAERGIKSGGTGFLLAAPMKRIPGRLHVHAVTNYHVAVFNKKGPPNPVIRVNRKSGKPDVFEFDPSEWAFKASGPDVAISPPLSLTNDHDVSFIDTESFPLSSQEEVDNDVGPADDVFMIGRFVDYDGVETNVPAARFGHISMMDVRIPQATGYRGRSLILDMHSRSGFSGSPVFVYRTIGSHFMMSPEKKGTVLTGGGHYMKLLGIHYAQFPESWEIKTKTITTPLPNAALEADSHYVEGLSGMTCVVPAADIIEIFNDPELVAMREQVEKNCESAGLGGKPAPLDESAAPEATGANPQHREDFTGLMERAAKKAT